MARVITLAEGQSVSDRRWRGTVEDDGRFVCATESNNLVDLLYMLDEMCGNPSTLEGFFITDSRGNDEFVPHRP